jgi:hypothetical protein
LLSLIFKHSFFLSFFRCLKTFKNCLNLWFGCFVYFSKLMKNELYLTVVIFLFILNRFKQFCIHRSWVGLKLRKILFFISTRRQLLKHVFSCWFSRWLICSNKFLIYLVLMRLLRNFITSFILVFSTVKIRILIRYRHLFSLVFLWLFIFLSKFLLFILH